MKRELITGNEAIVKGALKAGLGLFAGYPITPASEIMHSLAKIKNVRQTKFDHMSGKQGFPEHAQKSKISDISRETQSFTRDIKFMHAEDEIASIHMCIGGSLAGLKTMTGTSGPGFSLMQEAIGAGHMLEIPMVIVNSQRVGPGTGMPTLPSQGDVLQTKNGAHGDYYPIVFAPNSVEECYIYTIEAFNAAEESLSPVILLSDAFLSRLYETVEIEEIEAKIKNRERKKFGKEKRHFTALLNKEGILKTRDSTYYKEWLARIKNKMNETAKNYEYYEYIENKDSKTLLISYGITSRVLYDLKNEYAIFRPISLFPILDKIKEIAEDYEKIVVVEMNNGQYAQEIERILRKPVKVISQLGGKISLESIKEQLK